MRLSLLAAPAITELLVRQFGSEPPGSLVELIFSKTEGNPFFVNEVLRHLNETGKLLTETGKFSENIAVSDADLTRGVRLIIEDRIGLVGTQSRELLTIAAVAGRTFTFDLLVETNAKIDPDEILDAVEESESKHLIEDISVDRIARYRFVHEQIRQTLLLSLSLPRRQRLHLRIARAIEAGNAANPQKRAGEIGYHLYQAGSAADPGLTAHYLGIAGESDLRALAFEDGLKQFDRALAVLVNSGNTSTCARLQRLRAEALRGAERISEALEALGRAEALAAATSERDEFTLSRCRLLIDVWRGAEAVADLEALLARASNSSDARSELNVQGVLARAYYVMSLDHKEYAQKYRDAYERTIELARLVDDKSALGAALIYTANFTDYWPDYRSQVLINLTEAEAIARAISDEDMALDAGSARLGILSDQQSAASEEQMLERLLARRDPIRLNSLYFRMMWSTLSFGRLDRCIEICDAGIELAYRIGTLPVQYPTIKAFALLDLGRFDDAWASLEQEVADKEHRFGAALRDMGKMFFQIRLGNHHAALDCAPHVISESRELVRSWMLRWIAQELAGLALVYVDDDATLARINDLVASTGVSPGAVGKATLAWAAGDTGEARRLLGADDSGASSLTVRMRLNRLLLLALTEWRSGDFGAARSAIGSAVDLAKDKNMQGWLWRLLAEQATIENSAGHNDVAADALSEAHLIWSDIGGAISDPGHRGVFLSGPLTKQLRLAS